MPQTVAAAEASAKANAMLEQTNFATQTQTTLLGDIGAVDVFSSVVDAHEAALIGWLRNYSDN